MILIAVIAKLVYNTVDVDDWRAVAGQSSFNVDVCHQLAKLVVGQQPLHVQPLGVDVAIEGALLVHLEVQCHIAYACVELSAQGNDVRAASFGYTHHVDIAQPADEGWKLCPPAFQVLGDEVDGLV